MLKRSLAAGLLACVALAPLAHAQGNQPEQQKQELRSGGSFIPALQAGQFRSSDLMSQNVYNKQDETIGSIGDVLLDRQGRVTGVVIDVGGFLGIGANEVAVRFDALEFEPEQDRVAANPPAESAGRSAASGAANPPSDPAAGSGSAGMAGRPGAGTAAGNPGAADSAMTGGGSSNPSSTLGSGSDSTVHARIVLDASRDDLTKAPKLDDTAAREASGTSGTK